MTDKELYISTARTTVGGGQYFVVYDEDQFLAYSPEDQEWCYSQWEKKAIPMHCTQLVVQLVPDALFPVHGHDKPYIFMKRDIAGAPGVPAFKVMTIAVVTINMDVFAKQTELERMQTREAARVAAKKAGCDQWHINNGGARVEEGKR